MRQGQFGASHPVGGYLSGDAVRANVAQLQERVAARFPQHHLGEVAQKLLVVVGRVDQATQDKHRRMVRAVVLARVLAALAFLVAATLLVLALVHLLAHAADQEVGSWIPLVESTINTCIFIGLGVYFLWGLPERRERAGLLVLLHELRSLAHVLDMHQLTKEPGRLRPGFTPTTHSLAGDLDAEEMLAYLSYCNELFALIGKVAALCAERSSDSTVLVTVSDVETLAGEISLRVYAKMTLLAQGPAPR